LKAAFATALLAWALAAGANERRTIDVTLLATTVTVDVRQASPGATVRGGVVLVHGLLRSRETMAGHADELASRGFVAVAFDAPTRVDASANATAIREIVAMLRAGKFSSPVDRVVLVGFSMGALWSLLAADAPGVVGWVGLDPVDLPDHSGVEAAHALSLPATIVHAPPTPCNAYGSAAPWAKAFAKPAGETLVADATHCDFESPTDGWCRFFCGETNPVRRQAVADALRAAVLKALP
jgi:dienelactone hydrolase